MNRPPCAVTVETAYRPSWYPLDGNTAMNDSALLDRTASPTAAAEALGQSPIPILRRLTIEESALKVIISGRLPSYYYKQLAQETVLPYLAGRELINRVMVIAKG